MKETPFDTPALRGAARPGAAPGRALTGSRGAEERRLDDLYELEPPLDDSWDDPSLRRIGALLWRRRKVMLVTLLTVVGATAVFLMLQPPVYQAKARLQVNSPAAPNGAKTTLPAVEELLAANQPAPLDTQLEILRDDDLRQQAIARLQAKDQAAVSEYANVAITPVTNTNLINVVTQSYQPGAAQALTNNIVYSYLALSRQSSGNRLKSASEFVNRQLSETERKLNQARDKLQDYKEAQGIFDLNSQSQGLINRVESLQAQLQETEAGKAAQAAQLQTLRQEAASMTPSKTVPSEIVRRPAVEAMKEKLTELEIQKIALSAEYQDDSPEVQAVVGQIAALRRQLQNEAQTQVKSWQTQVNPIRESLMQQIPNLQSEIWASEARAGAVAAALTTARQNLTLMPEREKRLGQLTTLVTNQEKAYAALSDQAQSLNISRGAIVPSATVLSWAKLPAQPLGAPVRQSLLLALLIGIPLAIGMAALVDSFDDRVHAPEDARLVSHLPVVGQIPFIKHEARRMLGRAAMDDSPLMEKYRMLRTSLAFASPDSVVRSVVIASSRPGEGKSLTAYNLAVAAALGGERVVLVDGNLRDPSVHQMFGLPNEVGLTSYLNGALALPEVVQETDVPGLLVMTSGPLTPNSFKLLNTETTLERFQDLVDQADLVVVDSPAALARADAQMLAAMADAFVLVISSRDAGKREVVLTRDLLVHTGVIPVGVVLNKMAASEAGSAYSALPDQYQAAGDDTTLMRRSTRFFFG